ncbi:sugar ABC transporter ATP-binding protein [Carnimonas nigrificans]|uniref:sugar ABC transporter ATP-binding protein n=1 Tax=Carnimonas nigrificans TaxID=64323 RepID=UPI00046E7320|nr:sugar ABC transporter ATP-binding protein [Carnimonas nigrificans]
MYEPNIPLLKMNHISKTFDGIKALQDVSLTAWSGEVHALMGENGAGKSTLMKILSGALTPDKGGEILVDGQTIPTGNTRASRSYGIAVIYQELSLSPNLSVAQNIFLGVEKSRGGVINRKAMLASAKPVLDRLGVSFEPDALVRNLSLGECQLVEIARALSLDARIIVMDEPTTSLSGRETEKLFEVIARLKTQGIAVIYISHRMEEIYRLSDRCTVLRDGTYVGTLDKNEINAERLVTMMVGRDISSFYKKEHKASDSSRDIVLSVDDLSDGKLVKGCSFQVHRGEVLGISGLVGSGRTELLRLIYGADTAVRGNVHVEGENVSPKSPREALHKGIVYLTEDRKGLGLFLDMTISDNVNVMVSIRDAILGGIRHFSMASQRTDRAIKNLAIRTLSIKQKVGSLSGGNQQKVLLARLLEANPKVILLDEPTRGVDIGAKSEIYKLIDELASHGLAIVVVSSELPEIIGIADRCLVMSEGEIVGEVTATSEHPITQEALMTLSTGLNRSNTVHKASEVIQENLI